MTMRNLLAPVLCGALLAGCLAGCGAAAAQTASPETSGVSAVFAGDGGEPPAPEYAERFKPYESFGLTYDAGENRLWYNGKTVRWFEDYYPLSPDGELAGWDFFDENGVVDVYAVRDRSDCARRADGSYDPSGTLTGVEAFSEEEFAARDIEAIKNPPPAAAITGDPPSPEDLEAMAKEYEPFGVTYDIKNDRWYFNGEKVRIFRDVLTSNGEGLTSGKFKGAMRILGSEDGTADIYTVRDFAHPDASGYGTLTGIRTIQDS